jgi:hypothetical protein
MPPRHSLLTGEAVANKEDVGIGGGSVEGGQGCHEGKAK